MDKKLIIGLVIVAVLGFGAHMYIKSMESESNSQSNPPAVSEPAEESVDNASGDESATADDDSTVVPAPQVTTPNPAIVEPTTSEPEPEPESEGGSVEDILSAIGTESEDYDDSSVDTGFSGNLDEGI